MPDVQGGTTFGDNPFVREHPDLHGYASVPLTTHDGHAIGTLCVFDEQPRDPASVDVTLLRDLALAIQRELTSVAA